MTYRRLWWWQLHASHWGYCWTSWRRCWHQTHYAWRWSSLLLCPHRSTMQRSSCSHTCDIGTCTPCMVHHPGFHRSLVHLQRPINSWLLARPLSYLHSRLAVSLLEGMESARQNLMNQSRVVSMIGESGCESVSSSIRSRFWFPDTFT
jgi:hypothetical protein